MDGLKEEHSILRLAEGIAKADRAVTLTMDDAKRVLDRVNNLEHALAGLLRSFHERSHSPTGKAS